MMESTLLGLAEVRAAFRVVGDCRRVGNDVYAWNQCLVDGMRRYVPSSFVATFAFVLEQGAFTLDHAKLFYEHWDNPKYRDTWLGFYTAGEMDHLLTTERLFKDYQGWRVARRVDLITDQEWATCREFTELRQACNQDDLIFGACMVPSSRVLLCLSINRDIGQPAYTESERQWIELVMEELVPLVGTELSLDDNCPYRTLPPRLRQVFELLMQSETEKAIAAQLNISPHTVHEYVMELYRRFRVNRRSALMTAAYEMGWKPPKTGQ